VEEASCLPETSQDTVRELIQLLAPRIQNCDSN
jgi:hypothetical protein